MSVQIVHNQPNLESVRENKGVRAQHLTHLCSTPLCLDWQYLTGRNSRQLGNSKRTSYVSGPFSSLQEKDGPPQWPQPSLIAERRSGKKIELVIGGDLTSTGIKWETNK